MLVITKRRIRSLASNLPGNLKAKNLLLAVDLSSNGKMAQKVGFGEAPAIGDTILPKIIGPATKRNAYGRDVIRRDKEKETLYRSQLWSHEEWAGRGTTRTVTSIVAVPYKRYPRDHFDGPELELMIREVGDTKIVTLAVPIKYDDINEADLALAINVFLEVFGYVDVYDDELNPMEMPLTVRHLNWHVLPRGEKLTEEQLKDVLSKSKRVRPVEMLRQEKISGYGPAEIAIGTAGFTGYVIYVFPEKGVAVLESIRYGNASYILEDSNWESLSKMTKQQLLSAKLVKSREIHHGSWGSRIDALLR